MLQRRRPPRFRAMMRKRPEPGGNAFSKAAGKVNMLAYVVWASLFFKFALLKGL